MTAAAAMEAQLARHNETEDAGSPAEPWLVAALSSEAAELEYQALVNERSHFEAAEYWQRIHFRLGILVAILSVSTAGSLAGYFGDDQTGWPQWLRPATGILGLTLAMLTAVSSFVDPKGHREKHLAAGKRYSAFRTDVRQFRILEVREGAFDAKLIARLKELAARHAEIHGEAPSVRDDWHASCRAKLASNVHYRELRTLTGRSVPESGGGAGGWLRRRPK